MPNSRQALTLCGAPFLAAAAAIEVSTGLHGHSLDLQHQLAPDTLRSRGSDVFQLHAEVVHRACCQPWLVYGE